MPLLQDPCVVVGEAAIPNLSVLSDGAAYVLFHVFICGVPSRASVALCRSPCDQGSKAASAGDLGASLQASVLKL